MLGNMWSSSELTAEKLGITEIKLSFLRENGNTQAWYSLEKLSTWSEKTLET